MRRERRAIFVTDRVLLPAATGNRIRILGLMRLLRRAGCRVALVASNPGNVDQVRTEVDDFFPVRAPAFPGGNVDRFNATPYGRALEKTVAASGADIVIAEYAWMAPAMRGLSPRVLRCVDCHDILHERFNRFTAAGLDPWIECTRERERALLRHGDVLIAIHQRDASVLERFLPGKRVVCVSPYTELPRQFQRRSPDTMDVLAVGANHAGNDGIVQFAEEHWGKVMGRLPKARLRVVGAIGARLRPRPGVEAVGEVEDLLPYYESAAVIVCPVTVGTGLKIKVVEALRFGKATIATPAALEGLPAADGFALLAASLSECAAAVISLLVDRMRRRSLEEAAFTFGQHNFSQEAALAQVRAILPGVGSTIVRRLLAWRYG